jgi:hypothetical protein
MGQVTFSKSNSKNDDFLLVCPSASGIADAIHALYYLPANYHLLVLAQAAQDLNAQSWAKHNEMMGRVQFEDIEEMPDGTSPFSSADAVIADSDSDVSLSTPMVILLDEEGEGIENTGFNRFAVGINNPEALASAIMKIAKSPRGVSPKIHQYA